MNDRFKFRAWDVENKKYHEVIGLGVCRSCLPDGYVKNETQIFEQCTGLKDKNGKLIYEGDIVKQYDRHNRLKRIGWIVYHELEMKFKIETSHDEWSDKTESYSFFPLKQKLEVIGNIYENAELLND